MPSKVRLLNKHSRINRLSIRTQHIKASIRAKVEHPFLIIKRQFSFRKVVYRGLSKNDNKLVMLFALANVFRIDQMIRAARGQSVKKLLNKARLAHLVKKA